MQSGRLEPVPGNDHNPPDQAETSDQGSRENTAGDLTRGRRRPRSTDGGVENENGNESDMDLELLAESESDSDEDGIPTGEDRARRLTTGGYNPPSNMESRRMLYSDDDSSSGDEDVVENELDQVEDDEEVDEEPSGRDENSGARILERAGKCSFSLHSIDDVTGLSRAKP